MRPLLAAVAFSAWVMTAFAGESVGASWDNFGVGIFGTAGGSPGPMTQTEGRLSENDIATPTLVSNVTVSYEAPAVGRGGLLDFEFGDRTPAGSPGLASRLDALRADWVATDRRLEKASRDGVWHRVVEKVFPEPTVLRSGRLQFGGGAVSAVKQRNPFALIQEYPFFIWLSF